MFVESSSTFFSVPSTRKISFYSKNLAPGAGTSVEAIKIFTFGKGPKETAEAVPFGAKLRIELLLTVQVSADFCC